MRQVVLDTETTGLEVHKGHRLIEIGAVELVERRPSGRTFHTYLNPERSIDEGARQVTGIADDFLLDKPHFPDIADALLAFIDGAELVIHNAAFDVGFLDYELSRLGPQYGRLHLRCRVEDSLALARQRYPGQRNSLDALCRRLGVDCSHRQLHGALLDAQLLAEAYLALTSGQSEIGFASAVEAVQVAVATIGDSLAAGARPRVLPAAEEVQAHEARLAVLRKKAAVCVWDLIDA
jgi:DNA polymerase-3 subunit epsilon